MVSAVDHDPAVALAKAGGMVGQRSSQGTGATVKGPGEASLKMLYVLWGAKTFLVGSGTQSWEVDGSLLTGAEPLSSDKAGPKRESIPSTLLQEDGCTVIAMVGGTGNTP